MIVDEFWEPAENISAEIKIKRSIFIAHISVARTEEDARQFVTHISQKHKQATHNCWAYRIGVDPPREYSSDDGEPNGTAGKPILGAIQRFDVTNTVLVVTRYFGGIKLGVRGLIEAYGEAASNVLENAGKIRGRLGSRCNIQIDYPSYSAFLYQLKGLGVEEGSCNVTFEEDVRVSCFVPLSLWGRVEAFLCESQNRSFIKGWSRE